MTTRSKDQKIPKFIKPYFWYRDIDTMDLVRDKRIVIANILNLGTREATKWLFAEYGKATVKRVWREIPQSEFSRKSLNYWNLIFGVAPKYKTRIIN